MRIITLCGSTKFKKEFEEENKRLTLEGNIVVSVGVFGHADNITLSDDEKTKLDIIHLEKIRMSDQIRVIDVNGYIGSSTRKEIEYARMLGKYVSYYSYGYTGG